MKPARPARHCRAAFFFCALAVSWAASATDVAIGWAGPSKPEHALVQQQSAQLAIDEANQRNLVLDGQKLHFKLMVIDDKNNINFARIAAKAFVKSHVSAVIGHYTSDATLAALHIYADAGLPVITVFAAGTNITEQGYGNVFQLIANVPTGTGYLAQFITQQPPGTRVAIAHGKSAVGESYANAVEDATRKIGGQLAGRIAIEARTSDFNQLLSFIRQKKIDILYFIGFQEQVPTLAKRLHELKTGTRVMLTGGSFNPDFLSSAGNFPDGTMIMLSGRPEQQQPGFARFEKAYRGKYGKPPMPYAINAYDAANLVIQAILAGNTTDPAKISAVLHDEKYAFNGIMGKIAFDPAGRLLDPGYALYQVEKGKWKMLRAFP